MLLTEHRRRVYLLFVLCANVIPVAAFAQRGQDAGLVGTIRDGTGAVLTEVTVTVSSAQLIGQPRTAATDGEGKYRFPFLPPGIYDIIAEHAGFKSGRRASVSLVPSLTFTVDFQLDIASVEETVRVEAPPPPAIDVHTSSSSVLIDRQLLENLPLSRTVSDLVNLVPGVVRDVGFGGTAFANPLLLDGTSGNEPGFGTPTVHPNLNWIDELQVASLGADARFGEYTGAQANAITRSGSNRFNALGEYWMTGSNWTGNNRGSLSPELQEDFRPIEILERWDATAQVGGPIVKNRLWLFSGVEAYRDAVRPSDFEGIPRTPEEPKAVVKERKFIGKLTAAVSQDVRAEGYFAHTTSDGSGGNAGPLVEPDALSTDSQTEPMWNARLLWTMGSRGFLEVRHGGHDTHYRYGPPENRRRGPPGHYDDFTGVSSVSYGSLGNHVWRPITTGAHFTYFAQGPRADSHEFRTGFEYEHAYLLAQDGYVGGMFFNDYAGQPDTVTLWDGSTFRAKQDRWTWYGQDGWNATDRLTLNLGVRVGFYRGGVPPDPHAFKAHSIAPRAGVAWDVTGDHRTVARFHYGRYHDEMVTSFYDFLDPLSQTPFITAAVLGPNEFSELERTTTDAAPTIGGDITFPFVEEYLAAVERQLPASITVKAQYIHRDFKEILAFIDTGSVWKPFELPDPGPDGVLETPDDGGTFTAYENIDPARADLVLTNPNDAFRKYRAVQLIGNKRYSRNVDFQASYTWSRTVGSFDNQFATNAVNNDTGTNGMFVNPNRAINATGRTRQDFTHEVKVLGTYRMPKWGAVNVSGVYRYQSGRPWSRRVRVPGLLTQFNFIDVETHGTRHQNAINQIDLRLEKTWRPNLKIGQLGLYLDIFNMTNQGVELNITRVSGPNFGVPLVWTEPRTIRAGVRLMY